MTSKLRQNEEYGLNVKWLVAGIAIALLSACGGSSGSTVTTSQSPDNGNNALPVATADAHGFLVDSAVSGIRYTSGGMTGTTDENGRFDYPTGERIQFFIGDIEVGMQVSAAERLTPYELAESNAYAALNIARFLQSLDNDNNPENGIQIDDSSHRLAEQKSLDFYSGDWELDKQSSQVSELIMNLTVETVAGARQLKDASSAYIHYASTLDDMMDELENEVEQNIQVQCADSNECKIFPVETSFIGFCPPPSALYVYSETNTDLTLLESLESQRLDLKEMKGELYAQVGIDPVIGVCLDFAVPHQPVCTVDNQCEISSVVGDN